MSKNNKKPDAPATERPKLILPESAVKERAEAMAATEVAQAVEPRRVNGEITEDEPREAEQREPMVASCGSCRFFVGMGKAKAPGSGDREVMNGQCRCEPPYPLVVGMQQHPITNAVTPVVNGYFPLTNEDIFCGRWLPRENLDGVVH